MNYECEWCEAEITRPVFTDMGECLCHGCFEEWIFEKDAKYMANEA